MDIGCKQVKTVNEFIDAIRLRANVFIKEQGFQPGWEPDEDDKTAKHFIAMVDGKIVATARYRKWQKGKSRLKGWLLTKTIGEKKWGKTCFSIC